MNHLEKLDYIYKLAQEYYDNTGHTVVIEISQSFGCNEYPHKAWVNSKEHEFYSIDDVIKKFEFLTCKQVPEKSMQEHLENIYLRLTALELRSIELSDKLKNHIMGAHLE